MVELSSSFFENIHPNCPGDDGRVGIAEDDATLCLAVVESKICSILCSQEEVGQWGVKNI